MNSWELGRGKIAAAALTGAVLLTLGSPGNLFGALRDEHELYAGKPATAKNRIFGEAAHPATNASPAASSKPLDPAAVNEWLIFEGEEKAVRVLAHPALAPVAVVEPGDTRRRIVQAGEGLAAAPSRGPLRNRACKTTANCAYDDGLDVAAAAPAHSSDSNYDDVVDPDSTSLRAKPVKRSSSMLEDDDTSAPPRTPSQHDILDLDEEVPSPAKATPITTGAPGPGAQPPLANPDTMANAVPFSTNPQLVHPFDEWDYTMVESPMFLSAAISEFDERPIMLTGNWSLKPHLSIGTYWDGNIFLRSTNEEGDLITRIAPGLTMRLGDSDSMFYMMADYTFGANLYDTHLSKSTFDNDFRSQFQWSMPKTVLGLNLSVFEDTGQDIDVTNRVQREQYYAGVTCHHIYGEKTSWDLDADYQRSDYQGLISSSQIDGQAFVNYDYSEKTIFGLGTAGGYVIVPGGQDQTYEQANVRMTYRSNEKLTLIGTTGAEFRQYGGSRGGSVTPVFSVEGAWLARPGTVVDLSLQRKIYASAILADQDYTATSVDLSVRQRLSDTVSVSLAGGYVNADYTAAAGGVNASRVDNYFYVRPAVEWRIYTWLSLGVFYEYSQDISHGGDANSFRRDRGGINLAILF